jgi:hypothetical protein
MIKPSLTPEELEAFEELQKVAAARDEGPYDPPRPEFQVVRLSTRLVEEIRRLWALPALPETASVVPTFGIVEPDTIREPTVI